MRWGVVAILALLSGCVQDAPIAPTPAPEAEDSRAWIVDGAGEGTVSILAPSHPHGIDVPGAGVGEIVVVLAKTAPTDRVYWDLRDAHDQTVAFAQAGDGLARETNETFTFDVPAAGTYSMRIDQDPVATPGPVEFRVAWSIRSLVEVR